MTTRITQLDVARGIAILGTLGTNIWVFSHPEGLVGHLASPTSPGTPPWQQQIETFLQQVTNGKFLGLLTLMFGIGLAIQADSARRRGRPWPGPYLWRAGLLLLDGIVHYFLVIEFDVLMGYAVTGAVVAHIICTSPRTQRIWAITTGALHLALIGGLTTLLWSTPADQLPTTLTPNPYRDGSWWDLVLFRLDNAAMFRVEPVLIGAMSICMFLIGHRLHHAGLFLPHGATLRRRLMLVGAIALPLDIGLGMAHPNWFLATRYGTAPLVALGLLALIAHLPSSTGWFGDRMAELGRVALSAYMLQNILASAIFYGWGLDLGGAPPTWRLITTPIAFVVVSGAIIAGAHVWLRRFSRGPVEWLWHHGYVALSGAGRINADDARCRTPLA